MARGIVTLCGSHRFKDTFEEVAQELGIEGWIVLRPAFAKDAHEYSKSDGRYADAKARLDAVHLEKIEMSQGIVVINVSGYIGDSTKREILHARKHRKGIFWFDILRAPLSINLHPAELSWSSLITPRSLVTYDRPDGFATELGNL